MVERAVVLCDGSHIGQEHLPAEISRLAQSAPLPSQADPSAGSLNLKERGAQLEIALIQPALTKANGNQTEAARKLGLSRDELCSSAIKSAKVTCRRSQTRQGLCAVQPSN